MVEFKLIKHIGDEYTYEYYPNGDVEKKGIFCINLVKEELIYHKETSVKGMDFYGLALSGLRDENGDYRKTGSSYFRVGHI